MTDPFVFVPVVEGHGEVEAIPILIRRLVDHIQPGRPIEVLRPIRGHRSKLVRPEQADRFLALAAQKLAGSNGAVFVVLDADDDCPATLGPQLVQICNRTRPDLQVGVVLAVAEFEAWFIAAAESLSGRRGLDENLTSPPNPEGIRDAKGWIRRHRTDGLAYSETTDQPALTAVFDLEAARRSSASFAKFWRDIERLLNSA